MSLREAGPELRLFWPCTCTRCRHGGGSITGFSSNLFPALRSGLGADDAFTLDMRGIRSFAEEAWLSSITETLRTWRYVMQETYESAEDNKDD